PAEPLLALAQRFLGPLEVGDVNNDAHHADRLTRGVAHRGTPREHRAVGAVLVVEADFRLELGGFAGQVAAHGSLETGTVVRVRHPVTAGPYPADRAVLVPDAVLVIVHPPLPQGSDDSRAGRRPVLGQYDVVVVEPAGSELAGRVAGHVLDALAHEQGGPVL